MRKMIQSAAILLLLFAAGCASGQKAEPVQQTSSSHASDTSTEAVTQAAEAVTLQQESEEDTDEKESAPASSNVQISGPSGIKKMYKDQVDQIIATKNGNTYSRFWVGDVNADGTDDLIVSYMNRKYTFALKIYSCRDTGVYLLADNQAPPVSIRYRFFKKDGSDQLYYYYYDEDNPNGVVGTVSMGDDGNIAYGDPQPGQMPDGYDENDPIEGMIDKKQTDYGPLQ
ncbi:MAG: hypothetical protein PUC46_06020 [Lachnospiraceae bacterium]|nr:hypothetical protein [Lachnospiraceae bacterium]